MKTLRSAAAVVAGIAVFVMLEAGTALAQSSVNPTVTPVVNDGGWVFDYLFRPIFLIAIVLVVVLVISYLRYAPRFAKDEESARVVHADRVLPGKEAPRRAVDLTQAVPIVVQPPAIPAAVGAPPAPVLAAAPVATPAAAVAPAPAPAAATAVAAPAPTQVPAPAETERHEVTMDQETFDRTLEELLAQGTDRRIAEGKARRSAMIAARKKAAGEG
jgi:uncharacterized membrane protein